MPLPKVGALAAHFTLLDQRGKEVSLKDFRGKKNVVLYFYPKAMTPGCTVQAAGLRDSKKQLLRAQAVVLGVSPDPPERLAKFAEKEGLPFTLLSDPAHEVALSYGSWGPKTFMGKSFDGILRQTFIIGKDGRIKHIMEKVRTKTHHEDVIEGLQSLL